MTENEPEFVPHNDLEQQLLAAQQGQLPSDEFMRGLLSAQLFMPVQDDSDGIQGFQRRTDQAVPLTLESEDGVRVLILFTSPERAKPFLADFPAYKGGLLAEFTWILERIGSGFGVAINPGWSVGIDMDPDLIEQITGR